MVPPSELLRGTGKREKILRAAVEVFAQTGYFSSKVSEIARAAGVADGTIYLYFERKEDLLITIFREHMTSYLHGLAAELEGESSPEAKLRRLVRFHLEALGNDRALAVVFQVELRQSIKFMSLLSQEGVTAYLGVIKRLIEEGQSSGIFRPDVPAQLVANSVFGILDELVTRWILSEKEYDLAGEADAVYELILRGVL
jgi:TetR/AcrR family transcriptional regulator, fatty acid metabolism regulator protein